MMRNKHIQLLNLNRLRNAKFSNLFFEFYK